MLEEIAGNAKLKEGSEGVKLVLRELRMGVKSAKKIADNVNLPIPSAVCVLKEMEKEGMVNRSYGSILTDKGVELCEGLGISNNALIFDAEKFRNICDNRPKADVSLDQSHATVETVFSRIKVMDYFNAVMGRDILILGDDDLISVALKLFLKPKSVTVIEVDNRLVEYINSLSLGIKVIRQDLRVQLKIEKFETVHFDPPYTFNGFKLFFERALFNIRIGGLIFASYSHKPPVERFEIQRLINNYCLMEEFAPNFNKYLGAHILGSKSDFMVLRTVKDFSENKSFKGNIYTKLADRV